MDNSFYHKEAFEHSQRSTKSTNLSNLTKEPSPQTIFCCDPACLQKSCYQDDCHIPLDCFHDCLPDCSEHCTAECPQDSCPQDLCHQDCPEDCPEDCLQDCSDICHDTCTDLCTELCNDHFCPEQSVPDCFNFQPPYTTSDSLLNCSHSSSSYHITDMASTAAFNFAATPLDGQRSWGAQPFPYQQQPNPFLNTSTQPALSTEQQRGLCVLALPPPVPADQQPTFRAPSPDPREVVAQCEWQGCHDFRGKAEDLQNHVASHVNKGKSKLERGPDSLFYCRWAGCNASSKTRGHLLRHLKTHTGHRKHECDKCRDNNVAVDQRTFREAQQLKNHIKSMHEAKTIKCSAGCPKVFGLLHEMKDHVNNVHNKNRKYNCKYCDYKGTDASNRSTHVRDVHGRFAPRCEHKECDYRDTRTQTMIEHALKEDHMGGHDLTSFQNSHEEKLRELKEEKAKAQKKATSNKNTKENRLRRQGTDTASSSSRSTPMEFPQNGSPGWDVKS